VSAHCCTLSALDSGFCVRGEGGRDCWCQDVSIEKRGCALTMGWYVRFHGVIKNFVMLKKVKGCGRLVVGHSSQGVKYGGVVQYSC
jgi:hypothetical protein